MNFELNTQQPLSGFMEPVHDSQRVFRSVLDAMAHPGKIVSLEDLCAAPDPLHPTTAAICLSLVDHETPIWGDAEIALSGQAMAHLKFHCGCPLTADPKEARTVLVSQDTDLKYLDQFCIGTDERPDLSATVIVQVESLSSEPGVVLSGPGIKDKKNLNVKGIGPEFWSAVIKNNQLFPRGIDLILTAKDTIVCLPRTIQVEK